MTNISWESLEKNVRQIASLKWNAPCVSKQIGGVNIDGVVEHKSDYFVCIETTKRDDLQKVRQDINNLNLARNTLFNQQNIFCECYVVLDTDPTPSMRQSGESLKIKVISYKEFESLFIKYAEYKHIRGSSAFGSAIDPVDGQPDKTPYIPVRYEDVDSAKQYSVEEIWQALAKNKNVILIGDYGTGKSRCIKELFNYISQKTNEYCLSIDLRNHYGSVRGSEILRRHLEELGLAAEVDSYIKIYRQTNLVMLLDGFDEVATSQPWSSEPSRLKELRKIALSGVKDLISNKNGGILISGRPHYFDSDDEMFGSLGLNMQNCVILKCASEFTKQEMATYLNNLSGIKIDIPNWLPRKPLVCHVIKSLDSEQIKRITINQSSERDFWSLLLDLICVREAKFNQSLDKESIRKVLIKIAALTRKKNGNFGPITLTEMEDAFEDATGNKPSDASATMLNRLMTLGRTSALNSDRQFIDGYILDGLRAEHAFDCVFTIDSKAAEDRWINPLERIGISVLAGRLLGISLPQALQYIKQCYLKGNNQLAVDILCALLEEHDEIAFTTLITIDNTHIPYLCLSNKKLTSINFQECIIIELYLESIETDNVLFKNNLIENIHGVSTKQGLPIWINPSENTINHYQQVSTQQRIAKSNLTETQQIFLEVINRIFFQYGTARQESAIYNGFSAKKTVIIKEVLDYLVKKKILTLVRDNMGKLYRPDRKYMHRMQAIRDQLTLSKDEIWDDITSLKI